MLSTTSIRWALSSLTIVLLIGCAHTPKQENTFVSSIENRQLVLSCEGDSIFNTPCRLQLDHQNFRKQPVRFSTERTRYAHLLKASIKKAVDETPKVSKPSKSDLVTLQNLVVEECHPDATEHWSGDTLQLCVPSDPSVIVLFFRGVCDSCEFFPIVLKQRTDK